MFAIIETGGKQYKVVEGDEIYVEKLNEEDGAKIEISTVLAVSGADGAIKVGAPYLSNKVVATVVKSGKSKKLEIYRYKSKKNERKHIGHRQPYTKLQITEIQY